MSITITAGLLGMLNGEPAHETRTRITHAPEINLAVGNAEDLLALLGLDLHTGESTADDFAGRVLLVRALLDAATDDEHGRPEFQGHRWTDGARRRCHLAAMLDHLQVIADWAHDHNAEVVWS